jgi:hypothetical protein
MIHASANAYLQKVNVKSLAARHNPELGDCVG